jgi:hypothetical protein
LVLALLAAGCQSLTPAGAEAWDSDRSVSMERSRDAEGSSGRSGEEGLTSIAGRPAADPELAAQTGRTAQERANQVPATQDPAADQPPSQRLLIRSAELGLAVSNPESAIARFTELVEQAGGYIQERRDATLRARIPAERFEEVFATTRGLGAVRSESLQVQDVTDQHRDLQIRLTNAEKARERILALLERAEAVEDVLQLERELQRLTVEVEQLSAQLAGLQLRIAMSFLQVTFHGPPELQGPPPGRRASRFPWINRVGPARLLEEF